MTDKELKKLGRQELLELLLVQERTIEEMQRELEMLRRQLQDREIRIAKAGSIAEASLLLNGVFEAAQAAADQYLENLRGTTGENGLGECSGEEGAPL